MLEWSVWPIDRIRSVSPTLGHNGLGSDGNKGVLHILICSWCILQLQLTGLDRSRGRVKLSDRVSGIVFCNHLIDFCLFFFLSYEVIVSSVIFLHQLTNFFRNFAILHLLYVLILPKKKKKKKKKDEKQKKKPKKKQKQKKWHLWISPIIDKTN